MILLFFSFLLQITMQVKRLLLKMLKLAYSRFLAAKWDGKIVNVEVASDDKKNSPLLLIEAQGVLCFDINPILSTELTIDPV